MTAAPYMFIMQGLPGSGKSHWAKIAQELNPGAVIVSADDYPDLYIRDDAGKVTGIHHHKLGRAHAECFRRAIYVAQQRSTVVVDNTNTAVADVAPYILLAQAYGLAPVLVRVTADPDVCAARNTHAVPRDVMDRLAAHLKQFTPPSHWKEIPGYAVRDVP